MSGNSDSGSGIPPASAERVDCKTIRIRTQLASPNPTVVGLLKKDDVLTIQLAGAQGPLQAVTKSGQIAGGVITSKQVDLIDCINNGFQYQAVIVNINGGQCEILITAI